MVARPYLRTPRARVIQVTQLLHRKQQDFLLALSRGVIPDEIDQSGLEPRFVQKPQFVQTIIILLLLWGIVLFWYPSHYSLLNVNASRVMINKHNILNTCLGQIIIISIYCYHWLDPNQAKLTTHLKRFKTLLKRWCSWSGSSFFLWAVV